MCGIFGAVGLDGPFKRDEYEHFVAQTDLVAYRGPDDSGYLALNTSEQAVSDKTKFGIFLGHRRLSIIDLSESGRQPMTDGHGCWIIFNGEIFNYIELREELKQKGHQFQTATDTEVILKVYQEYGDAGFNRLNGMWAFALVDIPNQQVILSRDRFSIKPLYYTIQDGKLFFASEIKQLLPFLKHRSVNLDVMYKYLTQALADHTHQTFFQGIEALKPKHNLIVDLDNGQIRERQYWDYQIQDDISFEKGIEQFRELFIDSVRIRLRSDVKIGALVSGGLDSSTIAIVANELLSANVQTYSVVAENRKYSEERFINMLVQQGIQNQLLYFDQREALENLETVIYQNDEPFLGFHAVAQYQILEKIKTETDITVVLSGQGGDECLLGYSKFFYFYLQELVRRGQILKGAMLFCSSLLKGTTVRQFKFGEAKRYLPFRRSQRDIPYVTLQGAIEPIGRGAGLRERQMLDIDKYSVPVQTHFEDRNSMAHSLEIRTPFLDHRLVEFSLNLPVAMKLRSGWSKYVLRAAFPELPSQIRWRRDKQGFLTPEALWLRLDLKNLIERMFDGCSVLQELGILNDYLFLEYYREFLKGNRMIWYADISRVLIAEVWARRFLN